MKSVALFLLWPLCVAVRARLLTFRLEAPSGGVDASRGEAAAPALPPFQRALRQRTEPQPAAASARAPDPSTVRRKVRDVRAVLEQTCTPRGDDKVDSVLHDLVVDKLVTQLRPPVVDADAAAVLESMRGFVTQVNPSSRTESAYAASRSVLLAAAGPGINLTRAATLLNVDRVQLGATKRRRTRGLRAVGRCLGSRRQVGGRREALEERAYCGHLR